MKFNDLIPQVAAKAPGVPNFAAEIALRDAAIEFCVRTDAYLMPLEAFPIAAGVAEYDLTPPSGTLINHVLAVYRRNTSGVNEPLTPAPLALLYQLPAGDKPQFYSQTDADTLVFAPSPKAKETLYILYSVKPSNTATSIPDVIAKENTETLVSGAAYRLQIQSRMPWSDPKMAAVNKAEFDASVSKMAKRTLQGYVGGDLRVTPRAFV